MSRRERLLCWLATGPVGRVAAFVADLAVYWWQLAKARLRRRSAP